MPRKAKTVSYAISRRRKSGIIILCFFFLAILVWLDHSRLQQSIASRKPTEQNPSFDFDKYHSKTFKVINVVDGDTIDIDSPDGLKNTTRIRLWGVDTPETGYKNVPAMYFGHEAKEFASKLVSGKKVCVYLDKARTRGKYGRLLAYVQLPDRRFLNEALLHEGMAYADLRFRHDFYYKYKQLQKVARGQKKGLWQKVTREQLPKWLQRKKPDLLKK